MKKIFAIAVALCLIPFSAFGLEMLTDADMEDVVGQSGVAIVVDDIVLYTEGTEQIWFQVSDYYSPGNFAAVGFRGLANESAQTTFINAIVGSGGAVGNATVGVTNIGKMGLYMDYTELYEQYLDVTGNNYNHANHIGALKITVTGDLPIIAAALASLHPLGAYTPVPGVHIGLPSVEIYTRGIEAREIYVSTTDGTTDPDDGDLNRYGILWSDDGGGLAILGGAVDIAPLGAYLDAGASMYNANP